MNEPSRINRKGREGATIVEIVGYIAILSVIVNFCGTIFVQSLRMSALGSKALDNIRVVQTIREDFERDVHTANGIVQSVGEYVTSDTRIVLVMPPDPTSSAARRYIVYSAFGADRLIKANIGTVDGVTQLDGVTTYPLSFESLRFKVNSQNPADARLVTLELGPKRTGTGLHTPAPISIVASLRATGDFVR